MNQPMPIRARGTEERHSSIGSGYAGQAGASYSPSISIEQDEKNLSIAITKMISSLQMGEKLYSYLEFFRGKKHRIDFRHSAVHCTWGQFQDEGETLRRNRVRNWECACVPIGIISNFETLWSVLRHFLSVQWVISFALDILTLVLVLRFLERKSIERPLPLGFVWV